MPTLPCRFVRLAVATLLALLVPSGHAEPPTTPQEARLSLGAPLGELPRFGVNLGGRTVWGAEQLMANVLRNPGLEASLDGTLIVVGKVDALTVEDDTPWTAREPGFWAGGRYEVLSGPAAGQRGRVLDNQRAGPGQPDRIALQPMPAGMRPGNVLALQAEADPAPAPLWWTEGTVTSSAEPRPGSPGQRSVRLMALAGQPARLFHHLDAIGSRAGKLLPINGAWRLAVWVRGSGTAARLRLSFGRSGRKAWIDQTVVLSSTWQQVTVSFIAQDDGPVGPLMLTVAAESGLVQVDDVELGPAGPATTGGFRDELVQTLRSLRPGYLRDWQGQLADTPANRAAEPFARRPTRYRPGVHELQFNYSLPEFMALAADVGARPWLVLPATSTPDEARALGQWLRRSWEQHHFDEIVVEHGNEHWNSIFRPAGIADLAVLAEVADRAFLALRQGAGPGVPLHRVVGTQYVNPAAAARMLALSQHSEGVAVAPYFHYRQDAADSTEAALDRALHEPVGPLAQSVGAAAARGKTVDVYEVNFHTTGGSATAAQRSAVLNATAAGAALARRLLQAAALGATRQAVYSLAGHDSYTDRRDLVPLFGITRDLATPGQWRSTGQALLALNAVVAGQAHRATCEGLGCDEITAMAFGGGTRWAMVSSAAQPLRVSWPCRGDRPSNVSDARADPPACVAGRATAVLPARSWLVVGR